MRYTYETNGTCAKNISFDLDGDVVRNIKFEGGCNGNLQAIQRILEGTTVKEIAAKCSGIKCGTNQTSCADQLSFAVLEALSKNKL